MERMPITKAGFDTLKARLKHIKEVERPQNIEDIETARAHGDLSENAEYHAAREKQSVLTAQLHDLEDKISRAEVIDPSDVADKSKAVFGATVTVYDINSEEENAYQIVGDVETNVEEGKIGISSPLARAILGKMECDEIRVKTPGGLRELEIVKIEYK